MQEAVAFAPEAWHRIPPARRGFVLSTTKAGIDGFEAVFEKQSVAPEVSQQAQPACLAEDLARAFNLAGPVQAVSAACVSGLLAIQQGANILLRHEADLVVVAGVDIVSHFVLAGFSTLKSLDPTGCRPFDQARVGLSLGEGAGAVVMMRQPQAPENVIVVSGWGSSNDANHLTGPSRDGSGLALAMARALKRARIRPEQIDYVHLHGTGTPYNDAMESLALRRVFGESTPPFGSSKGSLGHTLGAAGILETILCQTAFEQQVLPGTPRLAQPDPVAPDSILVGPRKAEGLRWILKVSCGFGGTNAAIVLTSREATEGGGA
jgi:3-oxoacyl-[acyl-carrier-protein] synthase II